MLNKTSNLYLQISTDLLIEIIQKKVISYGIYWQVIFLLCFHGYTFYKLNKNKKCQWIINCVYSKYLIIV